MRADYSVNEGAGDRVELGGKVLYLCSTAEKMSSPFVLRVHGRSGHASMPGIADNALVKAAPLVARLGAFEVEPQLIPEVEGFLAALLGEVPPTAAALGAARAVAPLAGELIEPLLGMTVAPTMASASGKRNVIPALCEITVDVRLLPGQTPAQAETALRAWLGEGDYELVNTEAQGGTRSEIGGPLWDAVHVRGRRGARRGRGPDLRCRLHRLPLAARGVRDRRVRVLPGARARPRDGCPADPLGQRARAGERSRAGDTLAAARCAVRLRLTAMLELFEAAGTFEALERYLADELRDGLVADVYLGYGLSDMLRREPRPAPPEPCRLPLLAARVRKQAERDEPKRTPFRVGAWVASWSPQDYSAAVGEVRAAIARGDVYQVNLVQHLSAEFGGDPAGLAAALAALRPLHPRPLVGDGWAIVSASPELFLSRRGRTIRTMPIKGTRPLGQDVDDAKDAAEHLMIVDLERNDLSRVCEPGSIRWPELMAQHALAGVTHLVSTVEGRLLEHAGLAEILAATFPGGSITGAPKIAALDQIARSSRSAGARRWARSGRSCRTATSTWR